MASETVLDNQKKRTLEALERRFAVAKAELLQQQQPVSKKRFRQVEEKVSHFTNSLSVGSSSARPIDSLVTPKMNTASKKGKLISHKPYIHFLWAVSHKTFVLIVRS